MKLSFHFKFSSLGQILKQYIHYTLWLFLIFVLVLEFFVIKAAIEMVLIARAPAPGAQAQIIRVNFDQYKVIEKRLEDNLQFTPAPLAHPSPFGVQPTQTK